MRSETAPPPGSRSTCSPGWAAATPSASVVLPAPSMPSTVMSRPRSAMRRRLYPHRGMLEVVDRHPHARAVLRAAVPPDGAPSHAYLFHGPAGAGKREVARAFAAELLADGAAGPPPARRPALHAAPPGLTPAP